jgi:2'-5' RNA ligase
LAGLIASPGAIMVKGTYSANLAVFRQELRKRLADAGLPLAERYPTISGHVTVARFAHPLEQRTQLLQRLKADAQLPFGEFRVHQLDLVIHDWYNHHSKLIDSFQLTGEH